MRVATNYNFKDKRVVMRVDFNVPLDPAHKPLDVQRIKATIPTIRYILSTGASVVLLTHLGRPPRKFEQALSSFHLIPTLKKLLGQEVQFCPEVCGPLLKLHAQSIKPGQVLLVENIRFHAGEVLCSLDLAKKWAELGDVFVFEAFGVAHRKHTSTFFLPRMFKECFIGPLFMHELEQADRIMKDPQRPFAAVLGGAKVSTKLLLLKDLIKKADVVLIGGSMASTFIKALGGDVGDSPVEEKYLEVARHIYEEAPLHRFVLPVDVYAQQIGSELEQPKVVWAPSDRIAKGWTIADIGPSTQARFGEAISRARTIFWNGPVGIYEQPATSEGTFSIARYIAQATKEGAFSLIGGGDAAAVMHLSGLEKSVSHLSTGGGALITYLSGHTLHALEAIKKP